MFAFLINLEILFYFIYCCFVITLGVIVNKRLYQNAKNEEHLEKGKVIQRILKTFARVQYLGWPTLLCLAFALKLNKEVLGAIPMSLIHPSIKVLRAMYTLMNNYVGFNSLIIATTRYVFIVYEPFAEKIGIKRLRILFVASSIGIPVVTSMLNESINPVEEVWSTIFVPNYTYSAEKDMGNTSSANTATVPTILPLLSLPDHHIPSFAKYGMQTFWFVMVVSTYSNILEGIIYLHIYIYYFR